MARQRWPRRRPRPAPALIHISTDLVFDGRASTPYTEDDEPNPLDGYGRSKLEAERRVLELHSEALVVRTSLLVGRERPGPRSRRYSRPPADSATWRSSRTSGARRSWCRTWPRRCSS